MKSRRRGFIVDNKRFVVFEQVYEPAEDTFLMIDNLDIEPFQTVLDMGTGCGVLAILSAIKARRVVAVDINPYAVHCAKINAKKNYLARKVAVIRGDLFLSLRNTQLFDVILFNAPYLPMGSDSPKNWIDYSWFGGEDGRKLISRFIGEASHFLRPEGYVMLVQSTLTNIDKTISEFREEGFEAKTIDERKAEFESIVLMKAEKLTIQHSRYV